jgi:membrane associated rhomboid family serine protease
MLDQLSLSLNIIVLQTQLNLPILAYMVLALWVTFFISRVFPPILLLGIIPRTLHGLPGIIFAPLLHGSFNHLFFNTIPLLVLANFILIGGLNYFIFVTLFITITSGALVWCFGKPGIHIGASAVITGYWALLVTDIFQQGSLTAIILGLISAYYFAGIFFGIFPTQKGVSWEGHLFGLLSGVLLGYWVLT